MTVSEIRMRALAEEGNRRAARVLELKEQPSRMLSAILIGNNIANLFASSLTTSIMLALVGSQGVAIATGVLTLIVLIFGEITPKTMATLRAERLSMRVCNIIYAIMTVLTPVFGDDQASEIMVPRIDTTMFDINASLDEVLTVFREENIPASDHEESTDNVVGILNIKDLLLKDFDQFSLREVMREPYFTYESKNNAELFMEMRDNRVGMAIVLDEFGDCAGVVALEDLLEEIVGEIQDEYDTDEEAPWTQISKKNTPWMLPAPDFADDFDPLVSRITIRSAVI